MQLFDYQTRYLEGLRKNVVMAAETGTGKTIMALEHARRHGVQRLLVVAPASKVRTGDWQRTIHEYFSFSSPSVFTHSGMDYEVLSYDMFTKRANEFIDERITIIVDEAHFIANATTKRAKAVLKVAQVAHQWILLSATPSPNGWRSSATYAILTGLSRNKTDFFSRFVITDRSRGFPLILGYREEDTLTKWWQYISRPLPRTGDLVLPYQNIAIEPPMPTKLAAVYKKAVQKRVYGEELLDNVSKLFVTLRQIPTPARVDALHSVLDGTDENVVVFYNFNSEREAILAMLDHSFKERPVYEQSGHNSHLPDKSEWDGLLSTVTLVQYQSGSQAIELTYASITCYFSPPTSYANYEQSRGRTARYGQTKTVLFYHIAVEGSLDKKIWGIIKQKKDFSAKLLEENY